MSKKCGTVKIQFLAEINLASSTETDEEWGMYSYSDKIEIKINDIADKAV